MASTFHNAERGIYYKILSNDRRSYYVDIHQGDKRKRIHVEGGLREARRYREELLYKQRHHEIDVFKKQENPLFEEFVHNDFLPWSKLNKRSYKRDQQLCANLNRLFEGRRLNSITVKDVEGYKAERKCENSRSGKYELDRPVSNATVNREVSCLRKIFNLAIEYEVAKSSPVKKQRGKGGIFLQEPKKQERYIDADEFRRIYEVACEPFKPVLLTAYNTGMRSEEFLSLKWEQVKLHDPPLEMIGPGGVIQNYGNISVYKTKNDDPREVPINRTLWEWMRSQRRDSEDYVLKSSLGTRYSSIKDQFKNALRKAGSKPARIHDLRGSWATRMNENGVDTHTIMIVGGWSSLKVLERYLKRNKATSVLAVQTLDKDQGSVTQTAPKSQFRPKKANIDVASNY
jgi:integrase